MANTFQHRHYAAIAAVLADAREAGRGRYYSDALDDMQERLIRMFRHDNIRFSEDRFRRAAHGAPDGRDKLR